MREIHYIYIYIMIYWIQSKIWIIISKVHMIQQKVSQGHQTRSTPRPKTHSYPPKLLMVMVGEHVSYSVAVQHPLIYSLTMNSLGASIWVVPHLCTQHNYRPPEHHDTLPHVSQHPTISVAPHSTPTHQWATDLEWLWWFMLPISLPTRLKSMHLGHPLHPLL